MFQIVTEHPIALESYDHTHPKGTMQDNTHAPQFVDAVTRIFEREILACDLGCAGGGLVKDLLDVGHFAVGVEGSDYSLNAKRAEWATIPDNLFTADITKPFYFVVRETQAPVQFDLITAWEVLEHIAVDDLDGFFANLRRNLLDDGLFVASVAQFDDEGYHVTLRSEAWWQQQFLRNGFICVGGMFEEWEMVRQSSMYVVAKRIVRPIAVPC